MQYVTGSLHCTGFQKTRAPPLASWITSGLNGLPGVPGEMLSKQHYKDLQEKSHRTEFMMKNYCSCSFGARQNLSIPLFFLKVGTLREKSFGFFSGIPKKGADGKKSEVTVVFSGGTGFFTIGPGTAEIQ